MANTAIAYQALPAEWRELADKLWVLHTNEFDSALFATLSHGEIGEFLKEYRGGFSSTIYKTIHPLVRVHSETGERSLLLGAFARGLVGFTTRMFEDLRASLQEVITRPENTVRWKWQVNDLAIWDNRSTQHYPTYDYGDEARHVKRITIVGEVPVSVNGEASTAVEGDCFAFNRQTSPMASTADAIG